LIEHCPICNNEITEADYTCPNCGSIIERQVQTSGDTAYPLNPTQQTRYPSGPKKSYKKLIALISIVVIAIVIILIIVFFLLPKADVGDFVGTWDVSVMGSSQVWSIYEDGTIAVVSEYESPFYPYISFAQDNDANTLTVTSVDIDFISSTTQTGTFKLEDGKICITIGIPLCFDYEFSNNKNTLILRGMAQFTLTKTSDVPSVQETEEEPEQLKWEDITITGNCDTSSLGTYVQAGDIITNCSGSIILTYGPSDYLIGTFYFT